MDDSVNAAGVLGLHRPSMNDNVLLTRPPLGKPRTWCHNVPKDVTFGDYLTGVPGSTNELLNWSYMKAVHPKRTRSQTADYVAINKQALSAGMVNARQFNEYRLTHEVRRKELEPCTRHVVKCSNVLPAGESTALAAQMDTPIVDLVSHTYGRQWVQDQLKFNQTVWNVTKDPNRFADGKTFRENRASLLKMHQVEAPKAPFWKLPQFENKARPSIDSGRHRSQLANVVIAN